MSYTNIFNRPYFAVPPESPQMQLLLDRTGGTAGANGWVLEHGDGKTATDGEDDGARFSIAIYFGTLMMRADGASEREQAVRRGLGFPPEATVRIDYACSHDAVWLLRAGKPGGEPEPFSAFDPEALAAAEAFIADFLSIDLRTVLLARCTEDPDEDMLFAGEQLIYEGFLGNGGMPVALRSLGEGLPYAIDATMLVTLD